MNWLFKYSISALLISLLVSSCDQNSSLNHNDSNSTAMAISEDRSFNTSHQSIIKPKFVTEIVSGNSTTLNSYSSSISKDIGKTVYQSIDNIAARDNTNIELDDTDNTHYNNYIDEVKISQKPPRFFKVTFDNDIFNNTDYYYTNGVKLELITPFAEQSPFSKMLLGLRSSDINLYGFSIVQNIYTPTNPDVEEVRYGDRPFSAFLTIGQIRESYSISKKLSIKSSINFGVLGPASMGGVVQSSIHDIEPVGWNNQIDNSLVLDYSMEIEKSLISNPNIEVNVIAQSNFGTIFNNIGGGLYLRAGKFTPTYKGHIGNKTRSLQYWFFMEGRTKLVFYDATLQGSIFGNNDNYTINTQDINRVVLNASVGFAMYYNSIGMELQSFYLSPEFKNAYDFRWGRIKLIFKL